MLTLSLTKQMAGYYKTETEDFIVTAEKTLSGNWTASIERKTEVKKDILGNDVQMTELLFSFTEKRKKDACKYLASWIAENL